MSKKKTAYDFDPKNLTGRPYWNTDMGNAQMIAHMLDDGIKYCPPQDAFYVWDGSRWKLDEKNIMRKTGTKVSNHYYEESAKLGKKGRHKKAESMAKEANKMSQSYRVTNALRYSSFMTDAIMPNDMDDEPLLFNVANGLLDLETMKLHNHDKSKITTRISPTNYDASATCPQWLDFLDETFAHDQELISYFQQAVGYSMTGLTKEHALFFLYGSGSNGKSTAMDAIGAIMGNYQSKLSMATLQQSHQPQVPTEIAALPGVRMAISSEIGENRHMAEELVKDITGGDIITARHLYGRWFTFRPTFKLWIYGNHKPRIKGTDWGIWRRIKLIPFTNVVHEFNIDLNLGEKLQTELPGILNWMADGCRDWLHAGRLTEPPVVTNAVSQYRDDSDLYGDFFDAATVRDPFMQSTRNKDFWLAYLGWCHENKNYPPMIIRTMARVIEERGFSRRKGKPVVFMGLLLTKEGKRLKILGESIK